MGGKTQPLERTQFSASYTASCMHLSAFPDFLLSVFADFFPDSGTAGTAKRNGPAFEPHCPHPVHYGHQVAGMADQVFSQRPATSAIMVYTVGGIEIVSEYP